jgi:hypothetical protein
MIRDCFWCKNFYDDEFRSTICPHSAFPANDGHNNFRVHDESYLSDSPPVGWTPPPFPERKP